MNLVSPIEEQYVTDTHSLVWYLTNDKKLSARANAIFDAAEREETIIIIPAIAIAELYYLHSKQPKFDDFAATYRDIKNRTYFRLVAFEADEVLSGWPAASMPR